MLGWRDKQKETHHCERETLIDCLPYTSKPGIKHTTWACALTRNQTCDPSVDSRGWHSNQLSHAGQSIRWFVRWGNFVKPWPRALNETLWHELEVPFFAHYKPEFLPLPPREKDRTGLFQSAPLMAALHGGEVKSLTTKTTSYRSESPEAWESWLLTAWLVKADPYTGELSPRRRQTELGRCWGTGQ